MKSTKWLIALACALPVLGFLITVLETEDTVWAFATFLHQSNTTPENIKATTSHITHLLAIAWWTTAAGLIGGFIAAVILVVRLRRQRQSPPSLPNPKASLRTTLSTILFRSVIFILSLECFVFVATVLKEIQWILQRPGSPR